MKRGSGFIERHGLRTPGQARAARALARRLARSKLRLVRLAWADPHGASRAKALSVPAFIGALEAGYNVNVATTTLDSAGARVFSSFTRGGGMGLPEMTGSPNLVAVPDPATFRVLPWASEVGWALCDEYFQDGTPFHFSPRHLLKRQVAQLAQRKLQLRVGLEVEWYLLRPAEEESAENVGVPGTRGRALRTLPVEPGYSYHSESGMDRLQPVLSALAAAYQALGLPLRSIEFEWGPGQLECTFGPEDALSAADSMLLFRTATRQVCRRLGYLATFMARPALAGYYSSGWHLHQSLADARGRNALAGSGAEALSATGKAFVAGLLEHAVPATVFATPSVNGYRRYRPNSLAPDRAAWGLDHRGALLRVIGRGGDPATRVENRAGEPGANPYLFIAAQIAAGLDGIERRLDPGPPELEPYAAGRPALPRSLPEALDALEASALFRERFGAVFLDYYLKLKRSEAGRYARWLEAQGSGARAEEPTAWEQDEYLDFF